MLDFILFPAVKASFKSLSKVGVVGWSLIFVLQLGSLQLSSAEPSQSHSLRSPDGSVELSIQLVAEQSGPVLRYGLKYRDEVVLGDSAIRLTTTDGATIGDNLRQEGPPQFESHDTTWQPVYGERSTIRDHYNQLTLDLFDQDSSYGMQVCFRCYDAGAAFKVEVKTLVADARIDLADERSEFHFQGDYFAWCTATAQGEYSKQQLSSIQGKVERPLTIEIGESLYAAVAEAGLIDYAAMKLRRSKHAPHCLVTSLGSNVQSVGKLATPWRLILLGTSPGALLENNSLVLNLSQPCAIADTSWIKPGKVLREISLSTKGAIAAVDFAAKHKFQYVEFDAGWYGHEYDDESDATTVTVDPKRSNGPLNLPWIIDYAAQRDVGIILYVNRRALESQLDQILPLYQSWGIKGVKYGFVNTGSQKWTAWLHEAVRKAAKYELMVDVHDEYRPVGYSRTYPNLMTQEGVRGDEATPSGSLAVTSLFTRNLAGAADHTICYFDARVAEHWTHGHQLGKAVCTYSPWQFMFWYDTPLTPPPAGKHNNLMIDTPELELFAKVPTVWDETKVIHGRIGEYAVIARRSGEDWYIGAMNGDQPRTLCVPLDFLDKQLGYSARVYRDDPLLKTKTKVRIEDKAVDQQTQLEIWLPANGGQAIWITPS
jgi:alpha-glucosidase